MSHGKRISRSNLHKGFISLLEMRSTCHRAQVGCLILQDNRIIAMSYNGALPGENHCDDNTCNDKAPCKNSVHAEANIISFAAKHGIKLQGTQMICSYNPCPECAKLIIQAGIKYVSYYKSYRDTSSLDLLTKNGIGVELLP